MSVFVFVSNRVLVCLCLCKLLSPTTINYSLSLIKIVLSFRMEARGCQMEEHKKYLAIAAHKYRVCFGDTFFHEEARPRSF